MKYTKTLLRAQLHRHSLPKILKTTNYAKILHICWKKSWFWSIWKRK